MTGTGDTFAFLSGKRILLIANRSYSFWLFRREIIARLIAEGAEVYLASNRDSYTDNFQGLPVHLILIDSNLNTMNPLIELQNIAAIYRAIRGCKPDLVHTFTIKPNLYGPVLSRLAGVRRVVSMLTGFGTVMIGTTLRKRVLRAVVSGIYRVSFRFSDRIVVTNSDDYRMCLNQGFAKAAGLKIIPGAGVDIKRFAIPTKQEHLQARAELAIEPDTVNILFVGRMTREKGLSDLCAAFQNIRQENLRLHLAGEIDTNNPSALDPEQFTRQDSRITYHGRVERIERLFRAVDVIVLPSYREGMPTVLMEAAAAGLPAVATDVPGCREAVLDGQTGLLVAPGDIGALSQALERLSGSEDLRRSFGAQARTHATGFDKENVVDDTLALYSSLLDYARPVS